MILYSMLVWELFLKVCTIIRCDSSVTQEMQDVLLDPQTSGGLLLSMPEKDALEFISRMELNNPWTRIIGTVTDKQSHSIIIK